MKREFFLKAIGGIDDDLVCEAIAENKPAGKKTSVKNKIWRTCGSIAAAIILACGIRTAIEMGGFDVALSSKEEADFAPNAAAPAEDGRFKTENADGNHTYTADDAADSEIALETSSPDIWVEPISRAWYFICENGAWTEEEIVYRDGIPPANVILNEYLARIGSEAKCISVTAETVGEKTEQIGDMVVHTVGVRTAHVVIEGDLSDDELRGLIATAGNLASAHYVRPVTAEGVILPLDGEAPNEGYNANTWRK